MLFFNYFCKKSKIMKNKIKRTLQLILGYNNYLFIFSLYIIYTLKFQKKERDFLHFIKLLPTDKDILDIGANIGVMSYYLSKNFPQSVIYSFEPQRDNIITFKKVMKRFRVNNVKLSEIALGDSNGEIEMILPVEKNVKLHGLSHVAGTEDKSFNNGIKFKVPIKCLDDIEELKNRSIGGIKIDVENFEYFVLKGGKKLINNNRPIIYTELWDNDNRKQCIEMLEGMGYSCKNLINGELIPHNSHKQSVQNFFFIPTNSRKHNE